MGDRSWVGVVGMAVCLAAGGCGRDAGPTRYQVAGEVTFNGQPVPAGHLVFTPDTAAGNEGPQGFAPIRRGRFSTSDGEGRGAGSGAYRVEIQGTDGVPYQGEEGEVPGGRLLFPAIRQNVVLPPENCSLTVAVSGTADGAQATVEVTP